jgi:alpha-N-arabinofuranosidase
VVDPGETCDPSSACPSGCDDGNACTLDQMTGSAQNCNVACSYVNVSTCASGDGCCPGGCSSTNDDDCSGGTGGTGGTSTGGTGGTGGTSSGGTGGTSTGGAPTCDESTIGSSPNTLGVNVNTASAVVHKEIFGVLMETLGNDVNNGVWVGTSSSIPNTRGVRNDIIAGFKEAGVGAVEWPGGCAANTFNWQANLNPSNTLGVDRFMDFVGEVGAEAVLVGRPNSTYASSNQQWIQYVNNNASHPTWNLKYFKIGNEVWGCGGNLGHDATAEATYEAWYNAQYTLLDPPVNGKDLFLIAGTAGIWTIDPNNQNDWINLILGHIGSKIDGIEIHDYIYYPDTVPCVGFSDSQYYDILWRADVGQLGPRINNIRTIMNRNDPSGRVQIIEDEWGDWLMNWKSTDDWLQQITVMDALSAAITLNLFVRNADRVRMTGLAQAVNVIHSLFLTNSVTGGRDLVKTPTFYVYKMMIPHHTNNAKYAPVTASSQQITGGGHTFNVLSSAATVNASGQVNISLANADLVNTRDVTITLTSNTTSYSVASAQVITGAAKDTYNDFGQAERVNIQTLNASSYQACGRKLRVTLPSKSVVMLTLNPQ